MFGEGGTIVHTMNAPQQVIEPNVTVPPSFQFPLISKLSFVVS